MCLVLLFLGAVFLLLGVVILLLGVLLLLMGQVGAWYRVSSVFNWCGALFLCSKFCGVSCCAGCVGVGIESFSILGVVFFYSGGFCCVIFDKVGVIFPGSKFFSDCDVAAPFVDSCRNW